MKTLIPVTMFLLICCIPASSQIIPIKTYPILAGGEFLPLPSENAAMGGISIPLADQFRDPFVNPAALAGNGESFVTSSLRQTKWRIVQTESQNSSTTTQMTEKGRNDGNVSLPVAVVLRYDNVAVGAIGSYQHLVSSQYENTVTVNSSEQTNTSSSFSETANRGDNYPYHLAGAFRIPELDLAVGGSFSMTHIHGVSGMVFLYPNATSFSVSGTDMTMRLGITQQMVDSSELNLVAGRKIFETYQHAEYTRGMPVDNVDKNRAWFAQALYRRHLTDNTTLGLSAVGNWKEHPKIPDYPITGIPRDPGTTGAYNFGAGLAWTGDSRTTLAVEYVIEPISSKTWVEAESDQQINGQTVHAGDVTQRNNYTFLNHILRIGANLHPASWLTVCAGASLHSYSYDYEFIDEFRGTRRQTSPQMEWTEIDITGGLTAAFGPVALSYQAGLLIGAGVLERTQVWGGWDRGMGLAAPDMDFFLPPNPWAQIHPTPEITHQVSARYSFGL